METKMIILAVLVAMGLSAEAQHHATPEEAAVVAINEIMGTKPFPKARPVQVYKYEEGGNTLMYEVETSVRQSVLVAGSKACSPILAVYETGDAPMLHMMDSLPDGFRFFLDRYAEQIQRCFQEDGSNARPEDVDTWHQLLAGPKSSPKADDVVYPLLKSRWGQSKSNDGEDKYAYNHLIPPRWYCDHPLVGCVSVAMGQVMYYYNYPISTKEDIVYFDWCKMTDKLQQSPTYTENRYAVAHLLADCAEEVTLIFGCDATTSTLINARTAFIDRYGYSEDAELLFQEDHSSGWWKGELKKHLREGHPVPYAGATNMFGANGHAFVCDGFKGDLFHFNWGWNGGGNSLYCNIDTIYSNKKDDPYDHWLCAIFYLYPEVTQDICDVHMNLIDFYPTLPLWDQSQLAYLFSPKTMTTLTSASISSPAEWRTIPAGGVAEYVAHEEVILEDGFEAEWGSEFEARIEPCAKCDGTRGEAYAHGLAAHTEADQPNDTAAERSYSMAAPDAQLPQAELYPNPTDGPLFMPTDGMATAVLVYDLMGRPVGGWHLSALTETGVDLDVSALRPGAYLLAVQTEAGTKTARFVRK